MVARVFTPEEVASHRSPGDLWVVVEGRVLDVTEWAARHPGGARLLEAFGGEDCSDEFAAFHPPTVRSLLAGFQVGRLAAREGPDGDAELRKLRALMWNRGLFRVEGRYVVASAARTLGFAAFAALCLLGETSPALKAAGAVSLGIFKQQCLLSAHDVLHRAVLRGRGPSFWLGWALGSVVGGVGAAWWRRDHFAHHALPNVLAHDPSAGADPFIFIDAEQFRARKRGALERLSLELQPWTYFPLCVLFARFNLHFISVAASPRRAVDAAGVGLYFAWNFLLLRRLASAREGALVWLVAHLVCSVLHLQLNVAHFPAPMCERRRARERGFLRHQAATTVNIACSAFGHWFHGGLEYQLEHHLFPLLPRNRLGEVAPRVRRLLADNNLPYRTQTFRRGNHDCWKRLGEVGDEVFGSESRVETKAR